MSPTAEVSPSQGPAGPTLQPVNGSTTNMTTQKEPLPELGVPQLSSRQLRLLSRLPKSVHHLLRDPGTGHSRCPFASRRTLSRKDGVFTAEEVAEHHYVNDAWIIVDGLVYDITDHLLSHPGWEPTSDTTTPLSILAHAGQECSEEFHRIHRVYPVAYKQLPTFLIGRVATELTHVPQSADRTAKL